MAGKDAPERPIWFWPLLAFLLPIGAGGSFLLIQWSQWENKDKRQTVVDEKMKREITKFSEKLPSPSSPMAPAVSPVSPATVERIESAGNIESSDPPIDYQRCVVTLVKAFDYSFERASDKCKSDAPAAP